MAKSVLVKVFLVCSLLAGIFAFLTDVSLAEASRQDDLRQARVIVQEAKNFMNSGNFIDAARSFEKLIPLYPSLYPLDHEGYANLYFSIGGLYLKGASYDEAIPYCKKSIEMAPSHGVFQICLNSGNTSWCQNYLNCCSNKKSIRSPSMSYNVSTSYS